MIVVGAFVSLALAAGSELTYSAWAGLAKAVPARANSMAILHTSPNSVEYTRLDGVKLPLVRDEIRRLTAKDGFIKTFHLSRLG